MKKLLLGVLALVALAALVFYLHPLWVTDQTIRFHLWRQGVHSRYVMAGGNRLHYFEAGPADGKDLVLIHGLESRGEDWAGLIPSLADQGFHVYAPDLLGYGRSSKPNIEYSIAQETAAVTAFMNTLGIRAADVGGWSMGGWVAMQLALEQPARVDRLIVYDSAGVYFPPTFNAGDFSPSTPAGVMHLSELLSPHPRAMPDFIARGAVRKLQRDQWVVSRSIRSMESGRDLLDFRLGDLHKPVLVVWGQKDRLIPLAVGEEIHRKIAGSDLLVVQGCGHLAPAECLQPVLRGTLGFLKANPPPRGVVETVPGRP